jgi:hypothetical protein
LLWLPDSSAITSGGCSEPITRPLMAKGFI